VKLGIARDFETTDFHVEAIDLLQGYHLGMVVDETGLAPIEERVINSIEHRRDAKAIGALDATAARRERTPL
jgi:hypothetical protein